MNQARAFTARILAAALFGVLLVGGACSVSVQASNDVGNKMIVGAYYLTGWGLYTNQKSSDWTISGPYTPEFGRYNSADPKTADTQIDWALSHGISFFVVPFTHAGYGWEKAFETGFLESSSVGKIRFATMLNYEPYWSGSQGFPSTNSERITWMLSDIGYILDNYATHPSYMKIQGRPVLFLYHASTTLSDSLGGIGKLSEFLSDVRTVGKQRGLDLYLVGDVMYWRPLPTDGSYARLFDGVSAYTLPDAGVGWSHDNGHLVSAGTYDSMVGSYSEMNKYWSGLTRSLGLGFIPPVTPGFNNTGTFNGGIDDFLAVRTDSSPQKFSQMIETAASYMDTDLKMIIVEAWNEYHEGSVVEPTSQFGFGYLDAIAHDSSIPVAEYPTGGASYLLLCVLCGVAVLAKKRYA